MNRKPSFSIIVGTYNQGHVLGKVLEGWKQQTYTGRFEVFVCDDASSDNTPQLVEDFIKNNPSVKVKYLRFPERNEKLGCLARNLNQALPYLTGQYTFYCMGDTVPQEDTLEQLAKHVGRNRVLCGIRKNVDENLDFQSWDWRICNGSQDMFLSREFIPIGHDMPWTAITGNGLLIPTWAIQKLGGWDEGFVGYGEDDYDISLKLYELGLDFYHTPQVIVQHILHPVQPPRKDGDKLFKQHVDAYKERRRQAITSITLDFDDFSPDNNGLFYLRKLKEHFPLMKVSLFTIPFRKVDDRHVENWVLNQNLLDEINSCDWIEILPHGFFHVYGEFQELSYQQTKVAIAATEELFTKLGFNWKKIFKAPHWMIGSEALRALRDLNYVVATDPAQELKVPRGLKQYQHNCGLLLTLPRLDELRLHGHIQDWNGTGLSENFDRLLELPPDKPWKFVSELCSVNNSDTQNE